MNRRHFVRSGAAALAGGVVTACGTHGQVPATPPQPLDGSTFDAERRFASTRYGRIAYVERGAGQAALFLHGFPLSGFQWRGALERLASQRRCIAPDFMGLGRTEVAEGQSVAPEAQLEMLIAFLDVLAVPAVDLVASDSGGAVAQLFVTRHPDRVRTLLLTNCDAENDSPPPALLPVIELSKSGEWVDAWLAPWLADKDLARSPEAIGGNCYANPAHPTDEAIEQYFAPLVHSPVRKAQAHAYAVALERNPLEGIEAQLKRCAVPTRIVWGTADTIFSSESPGYLDRTFGNSRGVRRLAGMKLFFPEEVPAIIAEEARRLWGAG